MKKIFTLLTVLFVVLASGSAKSQGTGVQLIYAGDSSFNANCSLPDTVNMMFYGYAFGYLPTDSILIEINFGDGTSISYMMPIVQGTTFWDDVDHIYTLPGAYAVQYIATGPDGSSDTILDTEVLISSSCADISGRTYIDSNSDCIFNGGDTPYPAWVYAEYNGSYIAGTLSDANGNYLLSVPSGFNYTIGISQAAGISFICPSSGTYQVTSLPSTGNDFALQCNVTFDYTGNISGQGFRVNATTGFYFSTWNNLISCLAPTATVTIDLDPMVSYVSSIVPPISTSATQIVYNAGQLQNGLNQGFGSYFVLLTDPAAQIGDTLCLTLTIDPQAGDADPSNNIITVCMPVRNSCDPNEKYEIHAGAGTASIAPGTELSYTIMFQNVGNDVAFNVDIIDELDPNLDYSTLTITGFSHDADVYFNNNTLKFEFNNINLAAASVNEPMSHGYVSYKIMPLANLPNGTAIENYADIYFDFNAAIVTNTVTDIIDQSLGLPENNASMLQVYPNPASDYITIITGALEPAALSVYDVTGRLLSQMEVYDKQVVNTSKLAKGMYLLTLDVKGRVSNTKLTVE